MNARPDLPLAPPAPAAPAAPNAALGLLGGLLLAVGGAPALAVLGVPRLAGLEAFWRAAFGLLAIPLAFGLTATGAGLLAHRREPFWRLPWGRAVSVELVVASTLALLALAAGPEARPPGGAGGRVGWALATVSREAAGPLGAIALWLAAGVLATLVAFRVGADGLAAWLADVADGVEGRSDEAEEDDGPRAVVAAAAEAPPARPPRPPDARAAADSPVLSAATTSPPADPPPAGSAARGGAPAKASTGPAPRPAAPAAPTSPAPPPAGDAPPARRRPPPVKRAVGRPTAARRVTRAGALPEVALLGAEEGEGPSHQVLQALSARLEETLAALGVPVRVVEIEHGPAVTRFALEPGFVERAGERRRVPVARITALKNDLALALAVPTIRIEAPVAGRSVVGIEIPNPEAAAVGLRGLLVDRAFRAVAERSGLALAIGRGVSGAPIVADLARLPHLLVAGATGSGKSVALSSILASLLFQNTPDALRLILVDPKRVELRRFARLPHLLAGIVTAVDEVVGLLAWLSEEMDRRYRAFAELGARDLRAYNRRLPRGADALPRIVLVIDELADLMLSAPGEVEARLTRLAQLARATGIHLVVATQRPSTDVVTGLIKANFPARLAFAVASAVDSRVILDGPGAEALLGRGDLLFQPPDAPRPVRGQGALVSDEELEHLVAFWADGPWPAPPRLPPWLDLIPPDDPEEALYERAVEIALAAEDLNASLLQRRLGVGFAKARALVDRLRREGVLDRDDEAGGPAAAVGEAADDAADDAAGPPGRGRGDVDWVDEEFDG